MAIIFETENFLLESAEKPEIDRLDGGHLKISPKVSILDRTLLTPKLAIECMRLTILAGKSFVAGMKKSGIEIGRINYQDNGNWTPKFHIHLYGRAINAKWQKFGDPIISGNDPKYQPLNEQDIKNIKEEIEKLIKLHEFSDAEWKL